MIPDRCSSQKKSTKIETSSRSCPEFVFESFWTFWASGASSKACVSNLSSTRWVWKNVDPPGRKKLRLGTVFWSFGVLLFFFKLEKKKVTSLLDENHLIHATSCHQQRNCPFNKTHSLATKISWSRDIVCGFYPTEIFHSKKTKNPPKCSLRFPQKDFSPMEISRPGGPALKVPYVDVNQKVTLQPRWEHPSLNNLPPHAILVPKKIGRRHETTREIFLGICLIFEVLKKKQLYIS